MTLFMTLLTIAALVVVDQLVKYWAVTSLAALGSIPLIPGVFQFTYVENRGAAFSMLENHQWLFVAFAVVVVVLIAAALQKNYVQTLFGKIALLLICAGAVGNMIDRVVRHFVVDMLHFSLINFPVFNVADIYVCVGVAAFCIYVLLQHKDPEDKKEESDA